MKKSILIAIMLAIGSIGYSQTYYYSNTPQKRDFSYQVGTAVMSYNDFTMVGYLIGVNYKERIDVGYFHVRDYKSKETFRDTRWGGFYASVMFPLNDCVEFGPIAKMTRHDYVWQDPYFGVEARFDISWNVKVGLEYGKADNTGAGIKLIWNIY